MLNKWQPLSGPRYHPQLFLIESTALRKMKVLSLNFWAVYHDMYLIRPLRMTAHTKQLLKHLVKSWEWKVTGFPYDRWNVLKIFPGFLSLTLYVFMGCYGGLTDQRIGETTLPYVDTSSLTNYLRRLLAKHKHSCIPTRSALWSHRCIWVNLGQWLRYQFPP